MENRNVGRYQLPELHGKAGRALFACGLWLRVGFVGASAAVVGVIQLFGTEASPLSALALAVGGAALAVLSWRRAHVVLDRADGLNAPTAVTPESRAVRTVARA